MPTFFGIYINLVRWFDISQKGQVISKRPDGPMKVGLGGGVLNEFKKLN